MKAHDPVSERIEYQIVVGSIRKIHLYNTFHAVFVQPFNETSKLIGGIRSVTCIRCFYGKIIAGGIAPEIDLVILLVCRHTLLIPYGILWLCIFRDIMFYRDCHLFKLIYRHEKN